MKHTEYHGKIWKIFADNYFHSSDVTKYVPVFFSLQSFKLCSSEVLLVYIQMVQNKPIILEFLTCPPPVSLTLFHKDNKAMLQVFQPVSTYNRPSPKLCYSSSFTLCSIL